jgi:hypothetical protein
MHNRTAPAENGDRLLARAARILEESRFLLAEVEEQVRLGRDLRRQGRELRAAHAALLRPAASGPSHPGR